MGELLQGKELLKKVEELAGVNNKKVIARACGYSTRDKLGKERVNIMKFMNAVLAARGFALDAQPSSTRGGRTASYRIQVQKNGNLLVGAAYTRAIGLEPGTEFKIQLGRKHIKLIKMDGSDITEAEATEE